MTVEAFYVRYMPQNPLSIIFIPDWHVPLLLQARYYYLL